MSKITCRYKLNNKYYQKTITVDELPFALYGEPPIKYVDDNKITKLLISILPEKSKLIWHRARCAAWGNL